MNPIFQKALKIIQIRPYSEGELRDKLKKQFPDQVEKIQEAIDELKYGRLINDDQLAEQFVNYWSQKQVGQMRIKMEARKKQLDEDLVEKILSESDWNEAEQAKKALEVKLRTLNEKDKYKRKQKMMRFLQGRGFSNGVIFEVVE